MTADLLDRIGLVGISDYMYRRPNPDVDESWYFETWMDTTESQRILKFQTISYQDCKCALRMSIVCTQDKHYGFPLPPLASSFERSKEKHKVAVDDDKTLRPSGSSSYVLQVSFL